MSFEPLYKLHRSIPQDDDRMLILDRYGRVYLRDHGDGLLRIPEARLFPELLGVELPELGQFKNTTCYGCRWELDDPPTDELLCIDVREAMPRVDASVKKLLLRGKPILEWLHLQRFCTVCGAELIDHELEEARTCPMCNAMFFPKISPAVIVLIKRADGKILLAYNRKFRRKCYSLIAGFVEAGETAEDAVRREVREEVGLEIKNLQYKYSQSWPFPDSLMMGFTAEYDSGDLQVDGEEIAEADFYSVDNLPELPNHGSIARRIIEEYVEEMKNSSR